MMHERRRWCVAPVATAEELAEMLVTRTWCLCAAFYIRAFPQYVFLNDSTSEDEAGEFGCVLVKGLDEWVQIESVTFSWCTVEEALAAIRCALAGEWDGNDFARPVDLRRKLDTAKDHRCHLCA